MRITETSLKGVFTIAPDIIADARGAFMEIFHAEKFGQAGIKANFLQENISLSKKGVIRALHFQWDPPLGKFVRIIHGKAFAVAVDLRKNSETLGRWLGFELSGENRLQLFLPFGFAFGFCALDDATELNYHFTVPWNPKGESAIIWNDPDIGIDWPVTEPILSGRDAQAGTFKEWLARPESDKFRVH
ncbi:MAG: dTDP-4-dehydrorhamnose 3,5-epimerase [bacterium]|nr:dTDP-4-dehydrorhamnose 3,5-epimerase [bacterium]